MKLKFFVLKAFASWVIEKLFAKLFKLIKTFRRTLKQEPGLALVAWLTISTMLIAVGTFIGAMFLDTTHGLSWLITIEFFVAFVFLAVNVVLVLFEAFKRERLELFDIIKDTQ
jgi:hypothetical protein